MYDNIYQHPKSPAEEIIADDDMLDGWVIVQRREREGDVNRAAGEAVGNEKIRGSEEVYVPADTADDAKKVLSMNDGFAKATIKQRFALLRKRGEVAELEMPDTAMRLRMETTRKLSQSAKG